MRGLPILFYISASIEKNPRQKNFSIPATYQMKTMLSRQTGTPTLLDLIFFCLNYMSGYFVVCAFKKNVQPCLLLFSTFQKVV